MIPMVVLCIVFQKQFIEGHRHDGRKNKPGRPCHNIAKCGGTYHIWLYPILTGQRNLLPENQRGSTYQMQADRHVLPAVSLLRRAHKRPGGLSPDLLRPRFLRKSLYDAGTDPPIPWTPCLRNFPFGARGLPLHLPDRNTGRTAPAAVICATKATPSIRKISSAGLPAVYDIAAASASRETLRSSWSGYLRRPVRHAAVRGFPELDVITRSAVVKNTGAGDIFLEAEAERLPGFRGRSVRPDPVLRPPRHGARTYQRTPILQRSNGHRQPPGNPPAISTISL